VIPAFPCNDRAALCTGDKDGKQRQSNGNATICDRVFRGAQRRGSETPGTGYAGAFRSHNGQMALFLRRVQGARAHHLHPILPPSRGKGSNIEGEGTDALTLVLQLSSADRHLFRICVGVTRSAEPEAVPQR